MRHPAAKTLLFLFFTLLAGKSDAQTFTEISQFAGINHTVYSPVQLGGGAAFFDYNNDGWEDIYITGGLNRDKLYHNNGDGTFTERGAAAGLHAAALFYTMGVVTGDIDNDGDRDVLVTTWGGDLDWAIPLRNILYRNNGNGTFTDIAQAAGLTDAAWSVSACMGDYNLDGYLDIYIGDYVDENRFIRDSITNQIIGFNHTGYQNNLYLNNGNNTFTDVAAQFAVNDSGTTLAVTFTDYDNDHDPDLYVVNDFGAWVLPNALHRNERPLNQFADVSVTSGANAAIYGMGVAAGDYDEDGDLDYYITNIGDNVLYRNNSNGTFTEVAAAAGVLATYTGDSLFSTGWGTAFLDYDNDTWLDLFVANGRIPAVNIIGTGEKDPHKLFKNNANGTFTDVSGMEGITDTVKGRGFATGDYDNDGDLDMVVVCMHHLANGQAKVLLYRNDQTNGRHWLKVAVQGTTNSRDAFGTRVEVYAGGRKWIREIDGGSSHASQNSSIAHFGLANYTTIDSVAVIWPGGNRFTLPNVPVDHLIHFLEGGQASVFQDVYVQRCQGDSILAGGGWQTAAGDYYDTLPASNGADSIIVTHLSIITQVMTTIDYTVCEDDSILVNGTYFYGDTTLTDTLSSARGCDSIVVSQITLRPWSIAIADAIICAGDSLFAGGAWQTESGSYYDTIPGDGICNYIVITALQVLQAIEPDTLTVFICAGDSFFAGGAWQTVEAMYGDTFASGFLGCDSVVVTDLFVLSAQTNTQHFTFCAGDSFYAGGHYQTEAGVYYDILSGSSGCDSIIVVSHLSFDSVFVTEVIELIGAGDSFYAGGAWQTEDGTYVDTFSAANGCDSIVLTELNVEVGIGGVTADRFNLMVYPNPSNSNFSIAFTLRNEEYVSLKLLDVSGKEMLTLLNETKAAGEYNLEVPGAQLLPGAYLLVFKTEHFSKQLKLIRY